MRLETLRGELRKRLMEWDQADQVPYVLHEKVKGTKSSIGHRKQAEDRGINCLAVVKPERGLPRGTGNEEEAPS